MDTVLALRDKVREIADDADLNFSYCWEWTLKEMGLTDSPEVSEDEDNTETEDDEEKET